ncbi:hypothetical protein HK102_009077, partial [Quaeritorhiza haematococci]
VIRAPAIPPTSVLCTIDPVNVEHFLKGGCLSLWKKGGGFEPYRQHLQDLLLVYKGDGIFAVDGRKWKTQRKVASHIFTTSNFRKLIGGVFLEETTRFVEHLDNVADSHESIDLHWLLHCLTLDSFGKIAFGTEIGCLKNPDSPLPFAKSFDIVQQLTNKRFTNPFVRIVLEHFNGSRRRLYAHNKIVDEFALKVIKARRSREKAHIYDRKDLLDFFMEMRNEEGRPMNDKQMRDIVLVG